MKKTKVMHPGCCYLFVGRSSANSSFIEDKQEAMKFITSCNSKLDGYLTIHDFLISRDGWQLLVELKDEKSILELYRNTRKRSRKAKKGSSLTIVWKIISEQMRGVLSNFVVYTNKKNGREGSKVARSYERFLFLTLEEAQTHLERMRKQLVKMSQRLRKYRPDKTHYRIPRSVAKGAIFLCSLNIVSGMEGQCFGVGCINLIGKKMDVLRALVLGTISTHNQHFSPPHFNPLE